MKHRLLPLLLTIILVGCSAPSITGVVTRFSAPEAGQGVAVDAEYFYAINNRTIGKYRKTDGVRVGGWTGDKDSPIRHLNAGVVIEGRLVCAHSNFPQTPAESSIEIWDAATMAKLGSHVFAAPRGSLTWAVPHGDTWYACFAHYKSNSDPALSRIVHYDAQWRELAVWSFPASLVAKFGRHSSSCGGFGPDGRLYVTGHDARELYVLELPFGGGEARWVATAPFESEGQAFAWDESQPGLLYSIQRRTKEVLVSRLAK